MNKRFTLGKKERLKSRKALDLLFSEGKQFHVAPFKLLYRFEKEEAIYPLQFGIGVSARNFKKAVDRNRVKRIVRECYRLQKNELQEKLVSRNMTLQVFMIYTARELPSFEETREKLLSILNKLVKLADENFAAHT